MDTIICFQAVISQIEVALNLNSQCRVFCVCHFGKGSLKYHFAKYNLTELVLFH